MVLICDSCSQRPAICYCFVDEAFLCTKCDASIHSANVLASKHDRVPLYDADKTSKEILTMVPSGVTEDVPASNMPCHFPCDICKENAGIMFCLKDRSVTCRECDLKCHVQGTRSGNHERILLFGAKVLPINRANSDAANPSSAKQPGKLEQDTKENTSTSTKYSDVAVVPNVQPLKAGFKTEEESAKRHCGLLRKKPEADRGDLSLSIFMGDYNDSQEQEDDILLNGDILVPGASNIEPMSFFNDEFDVNVSTAESMGVDSSDLQRTMVNS